MMLDVPGRPHTENLSNTKQTSPDRVGDLASNLANLRLRYELSPYVYSLAHLAHLYGDPVFPPPVFYWQDDPVLRELGHEKLIGRDLLVGIVAGAGETERGVYLPQGTWVDFHSGEWVDSDGMWLDGIPEYRSGVFQLPLFAKAGAIVPMMPVDAQTMNLLGLRKDGTHRDELVVRVFPDPTESAFTLFEDDGQTTAYLDGKIRTTEIHQHLDGATAVVEIDPADGTYAGAPASRSRVVEVALRDARATKVTADGVALPQLADQVAFDAADSGWYDAGRGLFVAKVGRQDVDAGNTFRFETTPVSSSASAQFVCKNSDTRPGESVYVVGNVPALGNWSAARGVKLDPNAYPKWTGWLEGLPTSTRLEWKCIQRQESGGDATRWQPGPNSVLTTPSSGFAGATTGSF